MSGNINPYKHLEALNAANGPGEVPVTWASEMVDAVGLEDTVSVIDDVAIESTDIDRMISSILAKIDVSQESVDLTEDELNFVMSITPTESFEAMTVSGYSLKPKHLFARLRTLVSIVLVEMFDVTGDVFRTEESAALKYKGKVGKIRKKFDKKEFSDEEIIGALGTVHRYFNDGSKRGYTSSPQKLVADDLTMAKFVLTEYPEKVLDQLVELVKIKEPQESDAGRFKHPVDLFRLEYLKENRPEGFLRGTTFKLSNDDFSHDGSTWKYLAQDTHIKCSLGTQDALDKVAKATTFAPFILPGAKSVKGAIDVGITIGAKDTKYTHADLKKMFDAFDEYYKIHEAFGKAINRDWRKKAKTISKEIDKLEVEDAQVLADIVAFASISKKAINHPANKFYARTVKTMRGMAYLLGRLTATA